MEYYDETVVYDEYVEPDLTCPGDSDITMDGTASRFLLIRGLRANVDESLLSKGLEKLYRSGEARDSGEGKTISAPKPSVPGFAIPPYMAAPTPPEGATPGSLMRIFLIRDRWTDESLQYGFAEYHDLSDTKAALAKAEDLGEQCTVSSKRITLGFPHLGIFPQAQPGSQYAFQMRNGASHTYHDNRFYASIMVVNAESPNKPQPGDVAPVRKGKKRPNDSGSGTDTLVSRGAEKAKKPKTALNPSIAQQWQYSQAQLRGVDPKSRDKFADDPATTSNDEGHEGVSPAQQTFVFHGEKDGKMRKCCLLCGTELPANIEPEVHIKSSPKHAANLSSADKCQQGIERLKKWGITEADTVKLKPAPRPQPQQYRDRAQERRQEEIKAVKHEKISLSLKPKTKEPPAPAVYGKGLSILQKSGWREGQGLGAGGTGISAPIEQNLYATGVGLGHEGSKKGDAGEEAARLTRGDRSKFLDKTREGAKERYRKM